MAINRLISKYIDVSLSTKLSRDAEEIRMELECEEAFVAFKANLS